MLKKYLQIHPEVEAAVKEGKPVVALESTIISHGMPYPQNVEMASRVEEIIRENGAVPATIAILDGVLKVGLTKEEIEFLATNKNVVKASRRDLPFIISKKLTGATTVATTMILADLAGVRVFATGGIGGVHRGAETTMDISADLQELANTNVAVICAGAKSILDIGLTLEYLETKAVDVIGYKTEVLPAFYTSKSNFKVNHTLNTPKEIADLITAKWEIGMPGGVLITNPIPTEYEMDPVVIDEAINKALKEMDELKITGNKTTPYLLAKIKEITGGDSLESNIKLVYNNCKLASQIAKDLY